MGLPAFHLAFPVLELEATRRFYVELLGCGVGRSTDEWLDLDFFGHQIVAHVRPAAEIASSKGEVDGKGVPVPHFGVVLEWDVWQALADKLTAAQVEFEIEPYIRFAGQPGEQGTFFLYDPSGNALEFKTFRDMSNLFATD